MAQATARPPTILVLGANGKLGRAVVAEILRDRDWAVLVRAGVRSNQSFNGFPQDQVRLTPAS